MKKTLLIVLMCVLSICTVFSAGQKEEVAKGPITIELWSSLSGTKAKIFDSQVAAYNESQNEVIVNVIHQGGYSILRQKVAAAANAKNMPTLLICDYIDTAWYAQLGLLRPMDGLISKEIISDYYPAMLTDLTYEGTLYALPYNRSTQGFFVNQDAIKKAGLEKAPLTWDEFKAEAVKYKDAMGDNYYYGYAFFNQFLYDAIAQTFGAEISTKDGEVKLTSPEMVEMFTFFQDLYKEKYLLMQPALTGGFEEQHGAFLSGNVATVFQTTSFIPTAKNLLPFNWTFEFIPAGKGGNAITIGGGNFAICSQASDEQAKAAAKFLTYMASDEIVSEFFMQTGNLPTKKSVMELDSIKAFLNENPNYQKVIDQLQYGKPAPSVSKNCRDIFSRMGDVISRIILNGEDALKVLTETQNEFQAEIDELKANGEFIK